MQVTVEVLEGLKRKMLVKVPVEDFVPEIEKRLKDLAPKVKIPGFRPGKVPFTMVRQRYEDSVRSEVFSDVIGKTYQQALIQEKIRPAGLPQMKLLEEKDDRELEYEAIFEVYPTITLHNLENVEIKEIKVNITPQDIDDTLKKIQKQQADWQEVERPAAQGDQVVIDFDGRIQGETFPGGSGKDVVLELGSNFAIPGFESGLIGAQKGQKEMPLTVQFPDDYYNKDIAGKTAAVKVDVHRVLEAHLPELNEEFAKKMGVAEGGIEELRRQIRDNLERDIERKSKEHEKNQIIEQFLAINPIEVPDALTEEEAARMLQQTEHTMKKQGKTFVPPPRDDVLKVAKQRVTLGLLFGEFIRQNHLQVDQDRLTARLMEIAAPYKDSNEVIAWYRGNKERMAELEAAVIEEQVFDQLLAQAKRVEHEQTFQEWLKGGMQ